MTTQKWKLVPVEPTPTQIRSGQLGVTTDCTKAIYRAMLEAAPPAPSVPECLSTGGMTVWGDSVSIEKCNNFVHLASQAAGFKDELINTRAELADVARDAERWRMLPAFLEEFEISYLRLEDAIDAAIAAEKGQQA